MTIPLDAIDPDAAYRAWQQRFLWHVDQLPNLVEATATIIVVSRGIRAAPLRERLTGGGYIDNMPVVDGPEARNARAVWDATRAYIAKASSHLGIEGPQLPPGLPDDVELARQWAYAANEWLAAIVPHILAWPDLDELEEALFRLIRRGRARLGVGTVRRARPELCVVCAQDAVLVDWVDGPDGSAQLSKVCKVCGQVYSEGEAA